MGSKLRECFSASLTSAKRHWLTQLKTYFMWQNMATAEPLKDWLKRKSGW